ncbi:hypothetical protein V8F33_009550 [Rhypophila sp. PSN 637]
MADRFSGNYGKTTAQVDAGGWWFSNVLAWSFKMDVSNGYMELNNSSYCHGLDPQRSIIFNGTCNGYLGLKCFFNFEPGAQRTEESGIQCFLDEKGAGGTVEITPSVSYQSINYTIPAP